MFAKLYNSLKGQRVRRKLVIGLIFILAFAGTTGFIWIETDHVIAPPSVRILTWLWSVFQF